MITNKYIVFALGAVAAVLALLQTLQWGTIIPSADVPIVILMLSTASGLVGILLPKSSTTKFVKVGGGLKGFLFSHQGDDKK